MTAAPLAVAPRGGRAWGAHAVRLLLLAAMAALATLLVLMAFGMRPLVVRSGSMTPAIATGDVVVTKLVRPTAISVGDVVTFRDASRSGAVVTHRAVEVEREATKVSFVTKGDANGAVEEWSVDAGGEVGKLFLRIPKLGYLLAWATLPGVRTLLVAIAAVLLGIAALRSIWRI